MSRRSIGTWVAVGALVVGLLGIIPAYLIFWNKPKLVYDQRLVEILLPGSIRKKLELLREQPTVPDKLLLVRIQNIGRKPSEQVEVWVNPPGTISEYEVHGPNPAYGEVRHSKDVT